MRRSFFLLSVLCVDQAVTQSTSCKAYEGLELQERLSKNNAGKGICDWVSPSHQAVRHFHREHSSV